MYQLSIREEFYILNDLLAVAEFDKPCNILGCRFTVCSSGWVKQHWPDHDDWFPNLRSFVRQELHWHYMPF